MVIDIGSENDLLGLSLSNFQPYDFIFDGIECSSMEGLLQSFKFQDPELQIKICQLVGVKAKFKGKKSKWFQHQKLYWLGKEYARDSKEYQELLDRSFDALSSNLDFFEALKKTSDKKLIHSIGKSQINLTCLTEDEFCSRLMNIRDNYPQKTDSNILEI